MTNPAIEASRAQWRQYFQGGGRFDIRYTLDELMTPTKAAGRIAVEAALAVRNPGRALWGALESYETTLQLEIAKNYFGDPPMNPALGISAYGLHLPTMPALPWEMISAVIISNQLSAMAQATNGHILETPPVGNASTLVRSDFNYLTLMGVITTDAHAARALVANPAHADVVTVMDTPTGGAIGNIAIHLDPYLGPEQIVEFLFMLDLLTDDRGIKVYQVAQGIDITLTAEAIRKLN